MVKAYRPNTLTEALEILSTEKCTIMAGGTDLMVQRARGSAVLPGFDRPLMFVGHLKELQKIYQDEEGIHIGAAAILTDMMEHELIPGIFKEMIGQMASPPTRNMATIAGNICNASPAGDTLPYLYAVNAQIVLQSTDQKRIIATRDFIISPKKTCIKPDEILVKIIIPAKEYSNNYYRKLGQRKGMSLTKVSLLGMADVVDGNILDLHIALGSVAASIVHSPKIEKSMISKKAGEIKEMAEEIVKQYADLIRPIDDARSTAIYRKKASLRLIKDFMENISQE
ncbi:MAG: FAD binding domain-containing protein [Candidatus Marinimicrobia bacterium]|nr:FAD binding domain-containing protein [Candidatus Neomarinimicrobiota bacterium]